MDWLDLLVVQGTLKSLLQYHSSKASVLRCSTFFMFQLSHPYTTTGKAIALTMENHTWPLCCKVMSLLFNMLSRFVIAFLPRSIFNSMAVVTIHSDFGAQENKVCHWNSLLTVKFYVHPDKWKTTLSPKHHYSQTLFLYSVSSQKLMESVCTTFALVSVFHGREF